VIQYISSNILCVIQRRHSKWSSEKQGVINIARQVTWRGWHSSRAFEQWSNNNNNNNNNVTGNRGTWKCYRQQLLWSKKPVRNITRLLEYDLSTLGCMCTVPPWSGKEKRNSNTISYKYLYTTPPSSNASIQPFLYNNKHLPHIFGKFREPYNNFPISLT